LGGAEVRRLYDQKSKELAPRSVDYLHKTLQKALNQAGTDDLVPRSVVTGERPRSTRDRIEAKALSPTQVRILLEAAEGESDEALYVARATAADDSGYLDYVGYRSTGLARIFTGVRPGHCQISVRTRPRQALTLMVTFGRG
jgi:hypothetical protein